MRRNCHTLAVLMTSALLVAGAHAQNAPGMYGEVAYTQVNYKEAGYSLNPTALRAVIGYEITPNLAAEGMLGFGMSDSSVRISNVDVNMKVGTMAGAYIKPKLNFSDAVELFGRFGYARSDITASALGYSLTQSGSDLSYGAGVKIKIADKTDVVVDYTSYYNKNNVKAAGFGVGIGFKF